MNRKVIAYGATGSRSLVKAEGAPHERLHRQAGTRFDSRSNGVVEPRLRHALCHTSREFRPPSPLTEIKSTMLTLLCKRT